MKGNDHLGYIENANAKGNMLLVCDSFSRVVVPYLALTAGKIEWWDMRNDTGLLSYINEHPEIDNVVVMYNISFSVDPAMNDFR